MRKNFEKIDSFISRCRCATTTTILKNIQSQKKFVVMIILSNKVEKCKKNMSL